MTINTKRKIKWLVAIIIASATLLIIWRLLPFSKTDMRHCAVSVEHRYYYSLDYKDSTLFYFEGVSDDSLFVNLTENKREVVKHSLGCWVNSTPLVPSCKGRITTLLEYCDSSLFKEENFRTLIAKEQQRHEDNLANFKHAEKELHYYFDTHAKGDEGYNKVNHYREELGNKIEYTEKMIEKLDRMSQYDYLSVKKHDSYYIEYKDINNNTIRKECTLAMSKYEASTLLQICDSITPEGVTAVDTWHVYPLNVSRLNDTVYIVGRTFVNENDSLHRDIEFIPEHLSGDTLKSTPRLNIPDGAPVFTRNGIFLGITSGDTIINRNIIRKSI